MTVFSLSDLPAFFARDGYTDYVIEGVLPIGVTVAYGPTGTGKTGFAVATAMAVATGSPWARRNVSKGAVMYAATEDIVGVMKRLHGAATNGGIHSLPVHGTDEATALADPKRKGIAALEQRISELDISESLKLIVVDTLAVSFGPFSQDDGAHAASFMANMAGLSKRYDCAVLVIHHTVKGGGDMRASQVFKDAADALLKLTPGSKGADPIVTVEKQKNGPKQGVFSFTIGSTLIERGTEEVRQISVQAITNLRELSQDPWQALEEPATEEDRETDRELMLRVLSEVTASVTAVTKRHWQEAVYALWPEKSYDARKKAFSTHFNALKSEGKISVRGDKVTMKVTGNVTGNSGPSVTTTVTTPPLKGGGVGNVGEDPWEEEVLEGVLEGVDEQIVRKRRAG